MVEIFQPRDGSEVLDVLSWAAGKRKSSEIICGGSKRSLGRPVLADQMLDMSNVGKLHLYEPEELIFSAGPGMRITEIERMLSENQQMLAFEPIDMANILGETNCSQTLAGVISCNLSGPRRIKAGAARDHVLGVKGVSGRGEPFKSGGRVVKNVTGYDLSKLLTGSYGTLAALTEITIKVLPAPEKTRTVLVSGLSFEKALHVFVEAVHSPHEVNGLAYLPEDIAKNSAIPYVNSAGNSLTAIRIEGPGASVDHRFKTLKELLSQYGDMEELHSINSTIFWREVRDVHSLLPDLTLALWRISLVPSFGPSLLSLIEKSLHTEFLVDWAGGLLWLAVPQTGDAGAAIIRSSIGQNGYATLIRASGDLRSSVPVFHPQTSGVADLTRRIKMAFDPLGILNPGRMYSDHV